MVNNLMQAQESLYSLNSILNRLEKSKKQAETTLNNIMSAIEMGVVNKTTNTRMKELENQIEDIDRQILIEKSKASIRISEEDIRKYYQDALKEEPLVLINYLIKEIKLYNDKAEFTFNTPLRTSPNEQGSSFLSTTRNMKKFIQNQIKPKMIEIQIKFYV